MYFVCTTHKENMHACAYTYTVAAPCESPKKPTSTTRTDDTPTTKSPKLPVKKRQKLRLSEKPKFAGWLSLYEGDDDSEDRKVDTVRHSNSSTPKPSEESRSSYSSMNNRSLVEAYLAESRKLSGIAEELYFSNLSPIADYPEDEREDMFVRKLYFCQARCDFFYQVCLHLAFLFHCFSAFHSEHKTLDTRDG